MDRAWGCTGKHLKVRREWKGEIPAWDSKDQEKLKERAALCSKPPEMRAQHNLTGKAAGAEQRFGGWRVRRDKRGCQALRGTRRSFSTHLRIAPRWTWHTDPNRGARKGFFLGAALGNTQKHSTGIAEMPEFESLSDEKIISIVPWLDSLPWGNIWRRLPPSAHH